MHANIRVGNIILTIDERHQRYAGLVHHCTLADLYSMCLRRAQLPDEATACELVADFLRGEGEEILKYFPPVEDPNRQQAPGKTRGVGVSFN